MGKPYLNKYWEETFNILLAVIFYMLILRKIKVGIQIFIYLLPLPSLVY